MKRPNFFIGIDKGQSHTSKITLKAKETGHKKPKNGEKSIVSEEFSPQKGRIRSMWNFACTVVKESLQSQSMFYLKASYFN